MLREARERRLEWSAQAEFGFKADPQMKDQLKYALDNGIRFLVLFGEEELKAGALLCCALAFVQEQTIDFTLIAYALGGADIFKFRIVACQCKVLMLTCGF